MEKLQAKEEKKTVNSLPHKLLANLKRVKTKAIYVISTADSECMTVIQCFTNAMGVIQHIFSNAWFQIEYIYQVYGIKSISIGKERRFFSPPRMCDWLSHRSHRFYSILVASCIQKRNIYFNIKRVFARHFPVDDNEKTISKTRFHQEHKHI